MAPRGRGTRSVGPTSPLPPGGQRVYGERGRWGRSLWGANTGKREQRSEAISIE